MTHERLSILILTFGLDPVKRSHAKTYAFLPKLWQKCSLPPNNMYYICLPLTFLHLTLTDFEGDARAYFHCKYQTCDRRSTRSYTTEWHESRCNIRKVRSRSVASNLHRLTMADILSNTSLFFCNAFTANYVTVKSSELKFNEDLYKLQQRSGELFAALRAANNTNIGFVILAIMLPALR